MRSQNILRYTIVWVPTYIVILIGTVVSMPAQNVRGFPDDWSHHHVVFSNPGTFEEAVKNGTYERWASIVNDPRYRIQQMKRAATAAPAAGTWGSASGGGTASGRQMHVDWALPLAGGGNIGVAIAMYPAKFVFDQAAPPSCVNDFVVFPIDGAGSLTQADLLGANELYVGTCTLAPVPSVLFAYFVGGGKVQTSPVLSLDGKKVAFVESRPSSIFHVLTIDKSGNAGCPNSSPCNGTAYNAPAVPGTHNSAVDTKVTMSGGVAVTSSSPFVDYANDIAYVGDDTGKLHKFTGVFLGALAEAGSPWPVTVASGIILTGPVFDGGASKNIFIGGSDGKLYCVTSAGAACSTPSITVGSTAVDDAPIVDSTHQTVFAEAETSANVVLAQAPTALGSQVPALMGKSSAGQHVYNGVFDSAYFANVSTGHMYFCGNDASAHNTLLRVSFNSSGTMSSTPDPGSFALTTAATVDCTPLTAILNTSQGNDYLFLGITDHGFTTGTTNCANHACLASFVLPTSSPFTFPAAAHATLTGNTGNHGLSGMIIDNVSGVAGASQIYFGNLQAQTAVQVSQSALQ